MSDDTPILKRLVGVQHALISGAAGKPHSIVDVRVKNPRNYVPETSIPEIFEGSPTALTEERPVISRASRFDVEPRVRLWATAVRNIASSRNAKIDDLWVLIFSRHAGDSVQLSTRVNNDIISVRMSAPIDGSVAIYVRLKDVLEAVEKQAVPQLAILNDTVSYVRDGARNEFPFVTSFTNNAVKPTSAPANGFIEAKHLGTVLTEAQAYVKSMGDAFGREAVWVRPMNDGNGTVEVVAMGEHAAYRRFLHCKGLDNTLVLVPNWMMKHSKAIGANLGVRMSGSDYVWLACANGITMGIQMPDIPSSSNYNEYFEQLDGRVELTHDQVAAFRRALVQVQPLDQRPNHIGITPHGDHIEIRGKDTTITTPCSGDSGREILISPTYLAQGMALTNVRFIEFDKEDPEQYVRLSGPDVAVTIQSVEQPAT